VIAFASLVAVLTAAAYALLRSELRHAPASFPGPETGPATPPAGAHGVMAARQAGAGEGVVTEAWQETPVQRFARLARSYAGDASGVLTARAASLAQAPIPHLDVDWRDATDSFRVFCGIGVA
jgi:hypothetical protein